MYQYQVSFGQAIQMALNGYATFTGRSSRSEYWWWFLFTAIVGCAVGIFDSNILSSIVSLLLLLPNIAISVRRLHDINKAGWWYLINLIPLVGQIIFIIWACRDSDMYPNEYGDVPNLTQR